MRKLYAIGFKRHVELRLALRRPKEKVTESLIPCSTGEKFKLRCVHHSGGKVVKVMDGTRFAHLTGMYVAEGQMIEVPSLYAKQFLEKP